MPVLNLLSPHIDFVIQLSVDVEVFFKLKNRFQRFNVIVFSGNFVLLKDQIISLERTRQSE